MAPPLQLDSMDESLSHRLRIGGAYSAKREAKDMEQWENSAYRKHKVEDMVVQGVRKRMSVVKEGATGAPGARGSLFGSIRKKSWHHGRDSVNLAPEVENGNAAFTRAVSKDESQADGSADSRAGSKLDGECESDSHPHEVSSFRPPPPSRKPPDSGDIAPLPEDPPKEMLQDLRHAADGDTTFAERPATAKFNSSFSRSMILIRTRNYP
jgi:hypothetical protein